MRPACRKVAHSHKLFTIKYDKEKEDYLSVFGGGVIDAPYVLLPGVEVCEGLPDGEPVHDLNEAPAVCPNGCTELSTLPAVGAVRPPGVEDADSFWHLIASGSRRPL